MQDWNEKNLPTTPSNDDGVKLLQTKTLEIKMTRFNPYQTTNDKINANRIFDVKYRVCSQKKFSWIFILWYSKWSFIWKYTKIEWILMFLTELDGIEVLNSSNDVNNIILNCVNGQVIVVLILMLLNWSRTLSNRKLKTRI